MLTAAAPALLTEHPSSSVHSSAHDIPRRSVFVSTGVGLVDVNRLDNLDHWDLPLLPENHKHADSSRNWLAWSRGTTLDNIDVRGYVETLPDGSCGHMFTSGLVLSERINGLCDFGMYYLIFPVIDPSSEVGSRALRIMGDWHRHEAHPITEIRGNLQPVEGRGEVRVRSNSPGAIITFRTEGWTGEVYVYVDRKTTVEQVAQEAA